MKFPLFKPFFLSLFVFALTTLSGAEEEPQEEEVPSEEIYDEDILAAVDNLGPVGSAFPPETDFGPESEDEIDFKVLRDFIESKGLIRTRKCDGQLTIAGDVRGRWNVTGESVNGVKVRGSGTQTAEDVFRSEVNLFFDYVAPRSWVSSKLKWANLDGKDGGSNTLVQLDRAFLGMDIYHNEPTDFYVEIGRSRLDFMFDSRVEFACTYDGIHLYYTTCWPRIGKLIAHGGPFIIDSFTNDYAWIVEGGLSKICKTGLYIKYSYIDWYRHAPTLDYGNIAPDNDVVPPIEGSGKTLVISNPRYRFKVSQLLIGYEWKPSPFWQKTFILYLAGLKNHKAKAVLTTAYQKANHAWYIGFTLGRLCQACDWSIDLNYQYVQAQSVPEFDLSGLGHGNAKDTLLSDAILQDLPPSEARGFTNYKGIELSALYALTDSLSIQAKYRTSRPINIDIGGRFKFVNVEMAAIYAF